MDHRNRRPGDEGPSSNSGSPADGRLRIILCIDTLPFAGSEQHVLTLGAALQASGHDVRIACPAASELAKRASQSQFGILAIGAAASKLLATARVLARALRSGSADVVHVHNGRTALAAAIAVTFAGGGGCVMTQHFLEPSHTVRRGIRGWASRHVHKWTRQRINMFIAISEAVRDRMLARGDCSADRVRVVHNGIADPLAGGSLRDRAGVRAEMGVAENQLFLLCAARLETEKDIETLIRAIARLRGPVSTRHGGSSASLFCAIAGTGSRRDALQQQIHAAGLDQQIRLLGFRNDVLSLMQAADVLVLPSRDEPFGLVLIEAMALGKPVIAAASGGPAEIVIDDETGILFPPGDDAALAAALNKLSDDLPLRLQMGERGLQRYREHFQADRMARETIEVYRKVLGSQATA